MFIYTSKPVGADGRTSPPHDGVATGAAVAGDTGDALGRPVGGRVNGVPVGAVQGVPVGAVQGVPVGATNGAPVGKGAGGGGAPPPIEYSATKPSAAIDESDVNWTYLVMAY